MPLSQRRAHLVQDLAREAIGDGRFQAIADLQPVAPLADGQQQQDAVVLAFLSHAPRVEDGVRDFLDRLAFERRQGDERHLRAGRLLHGRAVLLQRRLALRIHDAGEIVDVALVLEGLPVNREERSRSQREDREAAEWMSDH